MFNFLDNRPSTSSSTRGSRQGYVNPTFQSSVFSHVNDNLSAARVVPDVTAELGLPARKKVERIEGYSFVLPTSHEYNPKSSDINNPDAHKDVERHGANIAHKKTMQDFEKQREHREKLNAHVRENMQKVEEKHQTRLDHKKPAPEVRQEYKAAETAYFEEVADEVNRVRNGKNNYAGNLKTQMDKKTNQRQVELEKERNDLRTGFTMKPRKEYDMQEYKDVLKNQMNEKSLKVSQAKQVKQNEREERLQELRDQEKMVEHYTQQLANRRPQSASLGGNTSISVNSGTLGKKSDWEAASAELLKKKDEQDQHLRSLKDQIDSKVTRKQQEINRKKEEERAIKGFDLANHRTKVTAQQVAEVLKTQMKQKQQVKDKEAEVKQGEVAARKEEIKGSERVAWQQYEQYRQKKAEMFDQYKQDHASYAPIKKNKGLMTVKIN